MLINEEYFNKTEGCFIGETGEYEPFTNNLDELFESLKNDYGEFRSYIRIDDGNKSKRIGWVFEKQVQYEDSEEYYIHETWVTVHEKESTIDITHYYTEV